jgi:hypothetical protein
VIKFAIVTRKLRTRAGAFLLAAVASAVAADKANDAVTITSVPDGAQVEWNRKAIGTTPVTYNAGEAAFNERKRTLFSKRLNQPIVVRVSKDGYEAKEITITKEMTWTSRNGENHYTYYIVTSNNFKIDLDKSSAAKTALTNADVLKLMAAGIGEDLIISKINNSPTAFQLEPDDLVNLHNAGLSDAIIQAMMKLK